MSAKQWEAVNEGPIHRVLYGELRSEPQPLLKIFTRLAGCYEEDIPSPEYPRVTRLCLYKLKTTADGSLEANIEAQGMLFEENVAYGIYLAYAHGMNGTLTYSDYDMHLSNRVLSHIPIQHESGELVEIGVYIDIRLDGSIPMVLMEMTRIVIKPKEALITTYKITDVHIKNRGQSPNVQKRIAWSWERISQGNGRDWPQGIPWSRSTGPFSSFTACLNGKNIGKAYCLEFPMKNGDVESLGDELTITIIGHMFGAGDVTSPSLLVPRADLITNGSENE